MRVRENFDLDNIMLKSYLSLFLSSMATNKVRLYRSHSLLHSVESVVVVAGLRQLFDGACLDLFYLSLSFAIAAAAACFARLLLGSVNFGNNSRELRLCGLDLLDDCDLLLGVDGHLTGVLLDLPMML